jgi:hypothetical protein
MCLNASRKLPPNPVAVSLRRQPGDPPSARSVFGRCIATECSVLAKLPACQGIPMDDYASHTCCWRPRLIARPPHHWPTRSIQGVALDRGLADSTRSSAVCQDPLALLVPDSVRSANSHSPRESASCRDLFDRNPTILSRLRVIVKPSAEALCKPFSAPVSRPRRSVALVSDACLRNPPIMPYAYADVKGLRSSNVSRHPGGEHPFGFL